VGLYYIYLSPSYSTVSTGKASIWETLKNIRILFVKDQLKCLNARKKEEKKTLSLEKHPTLIIWIANRPSGTGLG
jgi:hypothetical protein